MWIKWNFFRFREARRCTEICYSVELPTVVHIYISEENVLCEVGVRRFSSLFVSCVMSLRITFDHENVSVFWILRNICLLAYTHPQARLGMSFVGDMERKMSIEHWNTRQAPSVLRRRIIVEMYAKHRHTLTHTRELKVLVLTAAHAQLMLSRSICKSFVINVFASPIGSC